MAYEPTTWKSGDVVTSAKLNKLEKGVEDAGALIVHVVEGVDDDASYTLDKTWQEIYDAMANECLAIVIRIIGGIMVNLTFAIVNRCYNNIDGEYCVDFSDETYKAESPDDYPVKMLV